MREWFTRLLDWFRRDRLDDELAEEMRFHREQLVLDARADGLDEPEARQAAARRLGNVTLAREAARDRWSIPWLDAFVRDARYMLRGLRRHPRINDPGARKAFESFGFEPRRASQVRYLVV